MMMKMIKDEIILLNDCWPFQPLLGNGLHSPASHHHTPVHQVLLTTMMVVMMMMVMTITMSTVEKSYNLWKCCAGQLPGHSLPVPELHKWRGQSDSERQMIILMLLYYNIATDGFFILLMRIRRLNISFFPWYKWWKWWWWWWWKCAKQSEAQFLGSLTHLGHSDPRGPEGHSPPGKVAKKQAFFADKGK